MSFKVELKEFHKVAKVSDLADGEMLGVTSEGLDILLARIGDEYFALYGNCTHADALLQFGTLHLERCAVECPLHDGFFDLRTGECVQLPEGEPEPVDPEEVFAVKIEGDEIWVGPKE